MTKLNPNVDELALFDVVNVPGVGADLSHINSDSKTQSYLPKDKEDKTALAAALKGSDLVIIPAGVPRKPGMTRDDLFNINASIVQGLAEGIAANSPKAFVLVISNPVNSTVQLLPKLYKLKVFMIQLDYLVLLLWILLEPILLFLNYSQIKLNHLISILMLLVAILVKPLFHYIH